MPYLIAFCITVLIPILNAADESFLLRQMIDSSTTPGELHEDWLEEKIKSWPGLRTMDGVTALYDVFEQARLTKNGKDILACDFIQERLEVSPEQMVSFLLNRTQQNMDDLRVLEQDIRFLGTYADVPRVPKFLTSLLNDKRRLYEKRGEDLIGTIPRVCDSAKGELTGWLEKNGRIKFGDVGWTDALFDSTRDKDIEDIKPLLVKAGVIEATSTLKGSELSVDPSHEPTSGNQRPSKKSVGPNTSSPPALSQEPTSQGWLLWFSVAVGAATVTTWLLLRKARSSV